MCNCVENDALKILAIDYDNIEVDIVISGNIWRICVYIGNSAAFIGLDDNIALTGFLCQKHALYSHCDIGMVFDMVIDHIVKIDIADNIAVGEHDVIRLHTGNGIVDALECFKSCIIEYILIVVERGHVGWQDLDTARTARKVPVLTGSDMIHQRLIVIMRDNAYGGKTGVHHIGKRKIDEAVSAGIRNRCHCAAARKLCNIFIVKILLLKLRLSSMKIVIWVIVQWTKF